MTEIAESFVKGESIIEPNPRFGREKPRWVFSPSGVVAPEEYVRSRNRPIAIDLFSGAGGFSLGVMMAGFHVIAAVDNEPWAAITYMTNLGAYPCRFHFGTDEDAQRLEKALVKHFRKPFGEKQEGLTTRAFVSGSAWIKHYPEIPGVQHFFFGDIRSLTGNDILKAIGMERGEVDLVMGSPPCQGFSMAGKRNVYDPRNSLTFEFARMVLEIRPKYMVMENVVGMLSMVTSEGLSVVDAFCRILEDGGFGSFNALKRSLLASSGAGAALRGKKTSRSKKRRKRKKSEQPRLPNLESAKEPGLG